MKTSSNESMLISVRIRVILRVRVEVRGLPWDYDVVCGGMLHTWV